MRLGGGTSPTQAFAPPGFVSQLFATPLMHWFDVGLYFLHHEAQVILPAGQEAAITVED